jgi:zinc protease
MNAFYKAFSACLLVLGVFGKAYAILPIEQLDTYKGAKAYLVQTKALPMVDIEVSIDAGDRYDPAGKNGLADMTAGLMNYGARGNKGVLTEAQIADEIADLGANIGLSVGDERAILRIRSLSRQDLRERAVQLAASMLSAPTYDPKIVEREKQRTITNLREAETKPEFVLEKRFKKSVYGSYPLANTPTAKSVAAVTAVDLAQFHKQFYRGDRMIVSIVGDVDRAQANQIVQALLNQIPESGAPIAKLPQLDRSPVEPLDQREILSKLISRWV